MYVSPTAELHHVREVIMWTTNYFGVTCDWRHKSLSLITNLIVPPFRWSWVRQPIATQIWDGASERTVKNDLTAWQAWRSVLVEPDSGLRLGTNLDHHIEIDFHVFDLLAAFEWFDVIFDQFNIKVSSMKLNKSELSQMSHKPAT